MRNLKKILALVLALMMTVSLMVVASAANIDNYDDKEEISDKYAVAVEVLSGIGIYQGDGAGEDTFRPQDSLSRAEVAVLLYRLLTTDVTDAEVDELPTTQLFDDVPSDEWFTGYINYAYTNAWVQGNGDGTYSPEAAITGYELTTMLVRALGRDNNFNEIGGDNWTTDAAVLGEITGIFKGLGSEVVLSNAVTREQAAQMIFNALNANTWDETEWSGHYEVNTTTLGEEQLGLDCDKNAQDAWGRPQTEWSTTAAGTVATFPETPVATYDEAISQCDVATDLDRDGTFKLDVYTNGVQAEDVSFRATSTTKTLGGQGTLIEVYSDRLVVIDTYLAQVTSVNEAKYDAADHLIRAAYSDLTVWYSTSSGTTQWDLSNIDYAVGEYILVNVNESDGKGNAVVEAKYTVEPVQAAESFVGAQTYLTWNDETHTINNTVYNDAVNFYLDQAGRTKVENFTWFKDQFGNVIGNVELNRTSYAVLKDIIWKVGTPGYAEATLVYMDGSEATVVVDEFDGLTDDWTADSWPYNWNDWSNVASRQDEAPVLDDDTTAFPGVSSDSKYNDFYEGYALYVVTTNDDGTVDLDEATTAGGTVGYDFCSTLDNNSSAIILDDGTRLTVTANTQFLVRNGDGTYSAYNRATLPELAQNNEIFYTANGNVATRVYVKNGVAEAELGSHLFVTTDSYGRYAGIPNTFEMTVNVDGVDRNILTNEDNVKYLAANVGKLFHVTWELNPYAGFYGFVDELYLMNEQEDNEPVCDYMSSVTYSGNTLYNADDSYTVDADTVIVGNNGVIDASKGIWVICDDIKTTHAAVVYVGTKLGPSTAFDTDSKYEVVYDEAAKEYVITIPYTETDNDIDVWAVAQNAVLVYDGTAYLNLGYDGLRQEATLDITALKPGEEIKFEFDVWAENGVTDVKEDVTLVVEMTKSDRRSNLITGIADGSIICADQAAGYISVDKAPVLPLDISEANELTVSLINGTVKASWAVYTNTAEAEEGTAADFTAIGKTLSTGVLGNGNILVLKIEKTGADLSITLDDNYTTASALYVVYQINK